MNHKAPLAMMEQLIMVLVFSLAAALCLRAFVWADLSSAKSAARDRAVVEVQSAAETLKKCANLDTAAQLLNGTVEQQVLRVFYDEDWQTVQSGDCAYHLEIELEPTDQAGLATAQVRVVSDSEQPECLFEIKVAWQEVEGHARG